jgi:hypothetical protein
MSTALRSTSGDVADPPARPRWTALHYELPADDASTRAYLWRQMRARHAVNIHRGLWAVPQGPGADASLDAVVSRLRGSGAIVEMHPVTGDAPDADELHSRLVAACERLWSAFFSAADRLADGPGPRGDERGVVGPGRGLHALHGLFAQTLALDLAQSPAIARAVRRLDDLEWIEANVRRADAPAPAAFATEVSVVSTVMLHDGSLRAVARLTPAPPPWWERAMAEFEATVYRPDPDRAPVRHGTTVLTGTPDNLSRALAHVEERIARFNVTFS